MGDTAGRASTGGVGAACVPGIGMPGRHRNPAAYPRKHRISRISRKSRNKLGRREIQIHAFLEFLRVPRLDCREALPDDFWRHEIRPSGQGSFVGRYREGILAGFLLVMPGHEQPRLGFVVRVGGFALPQQPLGIHGSRGEQVIVMGNGFRANPVQQIVRPFSRPGHEFGRQAAEISAR